MAVFSSKSPLQQSWDELRRQETQFIQKHVVVSPSPLEQTLGRFVPGQLQATLKTAFRKAFALVFTKGDPVLSVLSGTRKRLAAAQPALETARSSPTRHNLNILAHRAGRSKTLNLLLSSVEGVSTGLFGIGIPDIPLFLSVALKTVYEIAASYGFSSASDQEKCLILRIIQISLSQGQELCDGNRALDRMLAAPESLPQDLDTQLNITSDALAYELLYWKFLQGTAVVGVAGGLSDVACLRRISSYAGLKYRRRFLLTLGSEA